MNTLIADFDTLHKPPPLFDKYITIKSIYYKVKIKISKYLSDKKFKITSENKTNNKTNHNFVSSK